MPAWSSSSRGIRPSTKPGAIQYCCTTYVGASDQADEYTEPHWLIEAIEDQGWHLEQLDYLCVELERNPNIVGDGNRPSCRIEAKLMFRRTHTNAPPAPPDPGTAAHPTPGQEQH